MFTVRQECDEVVCVGHILGAQGIKGEVRVFSNTDPRENIVGYSPWQIEIRLLLETENKRGSEATHPGRWDGVAKLTLGIDNRNQRVGLLCKTTVKKKNAKIL